MKDVSIASSRRPQLQPLPMWILGLPAVSTTCLTVRAFNTVPGLAPSTTTSFDVCVPEGAADAVCGVEIDVVVPSPSRSPSISASVVATPSRLPPTPLPSATPTATACYGVGEPGPFATFGDRILSYLHSLGEADTVIAPSPVVAVYIDSRDVDWSAPGKTIMAAADAGATMIVLSFYITGGATDVALAWAGAGDAARSEAIAYAHARGAVVLVAAGGSTDAPYAIMSGAAYGGAVATWAVANGLDGVVLNLENIQAGFKYAPLSYAKTLNWIIDASRAARAQLCSMRLLLHAPQAPYFGALGSATPNPWPGSGGGYSAVWAASGDTIIDGFFVLYYNSGTGVGVAAACYSTADGIFTQSASDCPAWPGTAIAEIASYGVPAARLIVGKPLLLDDASDGYVAPATLGAWLRAEAVAPLPWSAGYAFWQWSASAGPPSFALAVPSATPSQTSTGSVTASLTASMTATTTPAAPASAGARRAADSSVSKARKLDAAGPHDSGLFNCSTDSSSTVYAIGGGAYYNTSDGGVYSCDTNQWVYAWANGISGNATTAEPINVTAHVTYTTTECTSNFTGIACWPGDCSGMYVAVAAGGAATAPQLAPPGLMCAGGTFVGANAAACGGARRCFLSLEGVPEGGVPCPPAGPCDPATGCGDGSGQGLYAAWWSALAASESRSIRTGSRDVLLQTTANVSSAGLPPSRSASPTPVASASSSAVPSAVVPSFLPTSGDGYYCASTAAQLATRAALAAAGFAPSPCYFSFVRVYGGVVGPLQPVAGGTACVNGAFVFASSAICGVTVLPAGSSATATPSAGYTAPSTWSSSSTPPPQSVSMTPSVGYTASATVSMPAASTPAPLLYCVTNGPNDFAPPCYSYFEQVAPNGKPYPPQKLAIDVACYVADASVVGANATLIYVDVRYDARCAGVPSPSAAASPSTLHGAVASASTAATSSPNALATTVAGQSASIGCPGGNGVYCTTQCGTTLYECAAGVRYPPWAPVTGTLCYDASAANGGSGGAAVLVFPDDERCIAPGSTCATSSSSAVCYSTTLGAPAAVNECTAAYYVCRGGTPSPLVSVSAGTLCLGGALVFASDPRCAGSGSSVTPSPFPSAGAVVSVTVTVGGLTTAGGNLDPATVATLCSMFASLLSNETFVVSSRDVTVTGVVLTTPSSSPAHRRRGLAALAELVGPSASGRRLDVLSTVQLAAYAPPAPPMPGVPVLEAPPTLGYGPAVVTVSVRLADVGAAITVATALSNVTSADFATGVTPATVMLAARGSSLVIQQTTQPAVVGVSRSTSPLPSLSAASILSPSTTRGSSASGSPSSSNSVSASASVTSGPPVMTLAGPVSADGAATDQTQRISNAVGATFGALLGLMLVAAVGSWLLRRYNNAEVRQKLTAAATARIAAACAACFAVVASLVARCVDAVTALVVRWRRKHLVRVAPSNEPPITTGRREVASVPKSASAPAKRVTARVAAEPRTPVAPASPAVDLIVDANNAPTSLQSATNDVAAAVADSSDASRSRSPAERGDSARRSSIIRAPGTRGRSEARSVTFSSDTLPVKLPRESILAAELAAARAALLAAEERSAALQRDHEAAMAAAAAMAQAAAAAAATATSTKAATPDALGNATTLTAVIAASDATVAATEVTADTAATAGAAIPVAVDTLAATTAVDGPSNATAKVDTPSPTAIPTALSSSETREHATEHPVTISGAKGVVSDAQSLAAHVEQQIDKRDGDIVSPHAALIPREHLRISRAEWRDGKLMLEFEADVMPQQLGLGSTSFSAPLAVKTPSQPTLNSDVVGVADDIESQHGDEHDVGSYSSLRDRNTSDAAENTEVPYSADVGTVSDAVLVDVSSEEDSAGAAHNVVSVLAPSIGEPEPDEERIDLLLSPVPTKDVDSATDSGLDAMEAFALQSPNRITVGGLHSSNFAFMHENAVPLTTMATTVLANNDAHDEMRPTGKPTGAADVPTLTRQVRALSWHAQTEHELRIAIEPEVAVPVPAALSDIVERDDYVSLLL